MINMLKIFERDSEKNIGKYECSKDTLVSAVMNLLGTMDMVNPSGVVATANRAVVITKKGGNYVVELNSYNPPIEVEWSDSMQIWQLEQAILDAVEQNKKIGYINKRRLSDGFQIFQMAFA